VLLKLYVNWGNASHWWTLYVNSNEHFFSQHGCNLHGFTFVNVAWVTYFLFFTDLVLILAGFIKSIHADVYIHECCIAYIDIHTQHTQTYAYFTGCVNTCLNTTHMHAFINICHVDCLDSFVSAWSGSYMDVSMHAFFTGCIDECIRLV